MAALQRQIKRLPTLPEGFDVMELQFIAQVMGVYRSQVKQMLGVPYKTEFVKRGKRLDEKLTKKQRREALNSAFAITTSQQRKHGYLAPTPDASEPFPRVPSMRSVRRVAERLEDPNEAYETIMFYEDTLAMARKPKRKNPKSEDTGIRIKRSKWATVATSYYYYLRYKDGYIDIDGQSRWDKKKDLVSKLKSLGFIVKNNNQVFKKSNSKSTFMEN